MAKRVRVVTSRQTTTPRAVVASDNPQVSSRLTENEMRLRLNRRYATSTTFGGFGSRMAGPDVLDSGTSNFYSPQLSTDFLEKPQNLRERRAFYRFFYNTNEIVGQAIDIHSTLPLSKLRLVPPKGKNKHQNEYVFKFFEGMCENMRLFKTLIEITHEFNLFGNCCATYGKIQTFGGVKYAEDILVGDLVLTSKGRFRKVLKTCSRPVKEILRIKCWGFDGELPVTEEHPVEVYRNGEFLFIKAGELTLDDYIRVVSPPEFGALPIAREDKILTSGKDIAIKIFSIAKESYEDLVYNFEVEEDHTYVISNFSTHNCFIFCEDSELDADTPEDLARKKEEAKQRSEFLQAKYQIKDKNPIYKGWKKLIVLPPDQVRVRKMPLTDETLIEYVPDPETRRFMTSEVPTDPEQAHKVRYEIPAELREKVQQSGVIPLDTDPNTGSHVYHLARKKSQYEPLGTSIIERCINTLTLMDKLRQAQTSIASRHMTPMRIVWAEDLDPADIDNLREQVDLALVDPDYSIIANYEIHWEEMGSQGRLLDIEADYEGALNRLLAGLGVTREILTGEGTYTGSRISLEIMNTQYLLYREIIQDYVENYLFKPIAIKKGFVEYDDYGNEVVLYPRLSFTRLAIRDNEQFFDAAFQLYQKGSISIDLLLDILNIDPISTKEKLEKDLFTVNDSQFNEVLRNLYTNVATVMAEKTDLVSKLASYMKLNMVEEEAPPAEGASRFSSKNPDKDPNIETKIAKIIRSLRKNPALLDRIFTNGQSGQ